ncbi:MAG: 1-acyl-sn-glycerol-3-phosphate acyltransferase [Bacteroidia bacterium]|nr:1-acyl-sn-glycerol-3-phosphate acyltransferase [Bacteroidia bacterium]
MNDLPLSYDHIRPYFDEEVPEVLQRLSEKPSFFMLMQYLFPEQSGETIVERFSNIRSVEQFQEEYIRHAIRRMLADSAGEVTIDGIDKLHPDRQYTFLSNHRDIILDPGILNVILKEQGFHTTKIAIGDNLLVSGLVTDLMKLNKSFIVHREVARSDLMAYSQRLSQYIRDQIVEEIDSVWIAQRSGRTKDGNDETHTGLLKMLNISGKGDAKENFRRLNLIPMAVSYEYDPCDGLKAEELCHLHAGIPYEKDDKVGMIRGIRDPKGRIHLAFGRPVNEWIDELPEPRNLNVWLRELADALDKEIHLHFRLWPSNFIAVDYLEGNERHAAAYSEMDKQAFDAHMVGQLAKRKGDPEALKKQFLQIYAAPVWNREQYD